MLDIIICEDDTKQRERIENIIIEELRNLKLNMNINLSTNNPNDVIVHLENNKDKTYIYFLDVELNSNLNGIELAKNIRKYDPKGYIVFVTSHLELTLLTFQYKVQALDYIAKNSYEEMRKKVTECLSEAYNDFKNIASIETKMIPINLGNQITYFNLDDILFFETANKDHKLRMHTCEEQIEFYGTLKDIEKLVSSDYFKPHRSFLVNTKKIKSIDKTNLIIYMINDECCYIASRYLKGLLKKCLI